MLTHQHQFGTARLNLGHQPRHLADERVAQMLGEDLEMLEAIVSNDDNLSYGNVVSVDTATEENTKLITAHGIEEPRDMLTSARRSSEDWRNFLEDFVNDPDVIARVKENGPR